MVKLTRSDSNYYFFIVVSKASPTTRDATLLKLQNLLQKYHYWQRPFVAF